MLLRGQREISTITYNDFWGNTKKIRPDESINTSSDDVIELDITLSD